MATTRRRSQPVGSRAAAITASVPYRAIEAAVWPDGKLEVGGTASSLGTSGRSRGTRRTVVRNTPTSVNNAAARATVPCAQRLTSSTEATTDPTRITTGVLARPDPQRVKASQNG